MIDHVTGVLMFLSLANGRLLKLDPEFFWPGSMTLIASLHDQMALVKNCTKYGQAKDCCLSSSFWLPSIAEG